MSLRETISDMIKLEILKEDDGKPGRPRENPDSPLARYVDSNGGTEAVAEKFGISTPHLNKLIRQKAVPSVDLLDRIVKATNLTYDAILSKRRKRKF